MSEVSLSIGGRSYKVSCAPGEEAHIQRLGDMIDVKLRSMPQVSPQETQNLLFASLLLADELHEAKKQPGGQEDLRGELDSLRQSEAALREELEAAKAAQSELRTQAAALREERDRARAELEAAERSSAPSATADPELAPALERFAELLESCADKLEGSRANT